MCGDVVNDDAADLYRAFGFTVCCPRDIRGAVETCPEGEDLILEINSLGGSVYAGFEMWSLLRGHRGRTVAEIQSIAASAASVMAAGCGTVLISPVAQIMIHRASVLKEGTSADMKRAAQMLDTIDESICAAYVEKADGKTDRAAFMRMMRSETFLTAEAAVECGLADGILEAAGAEGDAADPKDAAASLDGGTTLRFTAGSVAAHIAAARLPPVEDLRKMTAGPEERRTDMDVKEMPGETPGAQEPTTPEELRARYPVLTEKIEGQAAAAERNRIAEIDAMSIPGYEGLIAEAKADPMATAGDVAVKIVQAQRESGRAWIAARDADVTEGHVNEVTAAAAPTDRGGGQEDVEAAAREAVALWGRNGTSGGET